MSHGFTKTELTDHQFAIFLRKEGAIDNFTSRGNTTTWRGPDGYIVALAIYDNAKSDRAIYVPRYPAGSVKS